MSNRLRWISFGSLLGLLWPAQASALPVQPDAAHARRVLLVHGIYDTGWTFRRMRHMLESLGWQVYSVDVKPNDASITFDAMARQVQDYVARNIPAGDKFDLVAFSMGGLVSRYYVQKLGGADRIRRFISISAPNHGTIWAWLSGRSGVRQMRPDSEMLRDLNSDAAVLAPLDYTSIYTPLDLTIVPASSSRMAVGRNVITWVPLHPLMLWMPTPLRVVRQTLEAAN